MLPIKKKIVTGLLAGILGFTLPAALAKPDATSMAEIQHLLDFIKTSPCQFVRNGKVHTPEEGHAHINKKFEHFEKKIVSAEMFIEKSAKGSYISGKPYHVTCPNNEKQTSQGWLLAELARYRKAQARGE